MIRQTRARAMTGGRSTLTWLARLASPTWLVCLICSTWLVAPQPASACGGLFCNNSQPVNQTAERIIFVDNGDDTTTAVIEIQYQGPSEKFAWVLPVPGIEDPDNDIGVSSTQALDRLQQLTNPVYSLQVRVEGECESNPRRGVPLGTASATSDSAGAAGTGGLAQGPVTVQASGSVGPFDWELIEVDGDVEDPAMEAVTWLEDNEYDVTNVGADLLRPYLEAGQQLLAVRLTKGREPGSIRPMRITYVGSKPTIPIKPTAVAADPDMGVMVWVGGQDRAIPRNYKLLTLNEAKLNWFSPTDNYNDVVIEAADDAGGHGFVTEHAARSDFARDAIVSEDERSGWNNFAGRAFDSGAQMFAEAQEVFSGWDGLQDALAASVSLPENADFDLGDVVGCPSCYLDRGDQTGDEPGQVDTVFVTLDRNLFRRKLAELVIQPVTETQTLLLSQPWLTRMYTTLSPEEMTEDPVFDFNPDLEAVDNNHVAERVIECSPNISMDEATWRVELTGGVVVRGVDPGVWPVTDELAAAMPGALRIANAGLRGQPEVMVDNVAAVTAALSDHNAAVAAVAKQRADDGCGCRVVGSRPADDGGHQLGWAGLLLGLLWARRRNRR